EALYVDELLFEPGAQVTVRNVRIYYNELTQAGASVVTEGCGELVNLNCSVTRPQPGSLEACVTTDNCPLGATCVDGLCSFPSNRYLSVRPANPGVELALRVTHDASGREWWVGSPNELGFAPLTSTLEADGVRDWSLDSQNIQIYGCGIVPGQSYSIQAIAGPCDPLQSGKFSSALTLATTSDWGDVIGTFDAETGEWAPGNGSVNFSDIQAGVFGFQQSDMAPPLAWIDLDPQEPNGVVNFADILQIVQGFQGMGYPYLAPDECP
ncbi:MAG: hypothetical protein ACPGXK_09025, partial [Phycisphaerae bacterium]